MAQKEAVSVTGKNLGGMVFLHFVEDSKWFESS